MKWKDISWKLTDHICKECGGRILESDSDLGLTPGGNPMYVCSLAKEKHLLSIPLIYVGTALVMVFTSASVLMMKN